MFTAARAPSSDPAVDALAALWCRAPRLARLLEATPPSGRVLVSPSRLGPSTATLAVSESRRLHLASRYDPLAEAEQLAKTIDADSPLVYVIGLGLGYHAKALLAQLHDKGTMVLFEPDLDVWHAAVEHGACAELFLDERVICVHTLDRPWLTGKLSHLAAVIATGTATCVHPPTQQAAPEFVQQVQHWIRDFAETCHVSVNTMVLNGRQTAQNIAANLRHYITRPGIARLKDSRRGQPAILISAGPSLRKNQHLLKDAQGKAVLISVQTTLQPMLDLGVTPDFVTSLDYHTISSRFFERLPHDCPTELVAEPKASDAVLRSHPGPISLTGSEFADDLLRELQLDRPSLPAGATVAHLAFYLAQHLGCDPIIFVGQDLGFSDGLCYTPGTSYDDVWRPEIGRFCSPETKQWEQIARDRPILKRIPDHLGRPMYTESRLFLYLQQFERDFASSAAKVIDATEGGALKAGTIRMTLAEALATFCAQPATPHHPDHPGLDTSRLSAAAECIRNRIGEASQIESIAHKTLPELQDILKHLSDQSRVNQTIGRIDLLRLEMNALGPAYRLVMQVTQRSELQRFRADLKLSARCKSDIDKQRRQVERDIENCQAVIDAASDFQTTLKQTLETLEAR